MQFFSFFSSRSSHLGSAQRRRTAARKLPTPLAPRRLEPRRLLDAAIAEALVTGLGASSDGSANDYVQVGENLPPSETASASESVVGPTNVQVLLGADELAAPGTVQLGVTFDDPDPAATHTAVVDWGDGGPSETLTVEPGTRFVGASHQYSDRDPDGDPIPTHDVTVTIHDDVGNLTNGNASIDLGNPPAPNNAAPTITTLLISEGQSINEGNIATLTGSFTDPDDGDTFQLDIDWDGDNTFDEQVSVEGGQFSVSHFYADDNPTATPEDTFNVNVRLSDAAGDADTASVPLTVRDTLPYNLQLDPSSAIDGNGVATIRISFEDLGTEDTHFARINWGDGTPLERIDLEPGAREVVATHQYLNNNPDGTPVDSYRLNVGIINDDLGRKRIIFHLPVENGAPVLTAAGDQTIDEGERLDLTGGSLGSFVDVDTLDTHTATVNWGDGTPTELAVVNQGSGNGTLDGSHTYADNGVYTVTVGVADGAGGSDRQTFLVTVNNVAPTLAGIDPVPTINEGTAFTLADLGVTLADPGFDGPLGPGGEPLTQETFTALTVDWGDGTEIAAIDVVNRFNGGPGTPTTAEFAHAPHTYADNGLYTVTVTVADDDDGFMLRTFQIEVRNVAPTLVLTSRELEIDEGDTLDLPDLGVFSDPGFNNPANAGNPSGGGEVAETFSYTIDWGDGTLDTGQLPATVVSGSAGIDTVGTLAASHRYLDNDRDDVADNLYTITVTLTDDDNGSVTEQIIVRVNNINPTLIPIAATDVNTKGETTLTLEFDDPGTEVITVWVDWGDKLDLPPAERYVPETFVIGPGTQELELLHTYDGPPDPEHPAADILLSVFIRDDDFGAPLVTGPGQSETQSVAISNAGTGNTPIAIDTTPQVPRLVFPTNDESALFVRASDASAGGSQSSDLRTAVGDTKSTTDRYLELRVIDPATGEEGAGYRLKAEVLKDLPALFRTLPDNRYAIYLVRTETNTRRLVIEVYVRNGKLIDPGDDSEGTRDRPPTTEENITEEIINAIEEPATDPELELLPAAPPDDSDVPVDPTSAAPALGPTLVGLAAMHSLRPWSERIDRALATADERRWHRLRHRRGRGGGKRG